jgi:lipopolysaccharide transport system ATP-binding protein
MMSTDAITVEHLSKKYRLGEMHTDLLSERLGNLFRRRRAAVQEREFWALRDVTFQVAQGEVLGIMGRNGAGKSTLLKILSRLTAPTEGRAVCHGRLASLLEIGTGFHPELSGRDNIYLNATIMGMRRREIARKFDEIVAFAGVERFLETPVKRYSSGMYVRLAFAVAAHIETDILVVDEVLAVGDAEFQKRCLGKMGEVARGGRTVLFVSHNLGVLRTLCTTGLFMDKGEVVLSGTAEECIALYESRYAEAAQTSWRLSEMPVDKRMAITKIDSALRGRQPDLVFDAGITLVSHAAHKPAMIAIDITDSAGTPILQAVPQWEPFLNEAPEQVVRVSVDLPPLIPGRYLATFWVGTHASETLDAVYNAVAFDIHDSPTAGRTFPHTKDHGHIVPPSTVRID